MSSVRKRGNKCYTRSNKSGATYVVCDDAPNGSKGQAGVYKAKNPTGKQDGRSKREEAEIDKQRAFNRVRKSMMSETYQRDFSKKEGVMNIGGGNRAYAQRILKVPLTAPATSTMKRDILNGKGKKDPDLLDGMGKRYIYTRWTNETKSGKEHLKIRTTAAWRIAPMTHTRGTTLTKDVERDAKDFNDWKYVGIDDKAEIAKAAKVILSGKKGRLDFDAKDIDDFPNKKEARDYESGKMKGVEVRRAMVERTLRYKHYLELAGEKIPDWVKDISD